MPSNSTVDLNEVASNKHLDLIIRSEKSEDPKDAKWRRTKDAILFVMAITMIVCLFLYAGHTVLKPEASVDDKRWATVLLTTIVSGLLGYLFGQKSNSNLN